MGAGNAVVSASEFGAWVPQSRWARREAGDQVGGGGGCRYLPDLGEPAHRGAVSAQRRSDSLLHSDKSTGGPGEAGRGGKAEQLQVPASALQHRGEQRVRKDGCQPPLRFQPPIGWSVAPVCLEPSWF